MKTKFRLIVVLAGLVSVPILKVRAQALYVPSGFSASGVGTSATGGVGIGTSSPQSNLHIHGTTSYGSLRLTPTSANGESTLSFFTDTAGTDGNDAWVMGHAGWGNTGDFVVGNENNGAGGNVRFLIEKAGNVGIGTTSPSGKLEVYDGSIRLVQPSSVGIILSNTNGPAGVGNSIRGHWGATNGSGLEVGGDQTGTAGAWISFGGSSRGDGYNSTTIFTNASAERMRITAAGMVGIGTTNPTEKLAVNGKIRAKEVIVDTGWSDYVFADDYRLAPLSEVEAHINLKKHLPGIPSAAEVEAGGVSLGEMQSKLLAKVEELTLHLIALEKRFKSLETENAQLKISK